MTATQQFEHIGGHPLIDFVNTQIVRHGKPHDQLTSMEDVVDWMVDVGMIVENSIKFSTADAPDMLSQVRAFRQQIRDMLATIVDGRPIADETVNAINTLLLHWQGRPQLTKRDDTFVRRITCDLTHPAQVLGCLADAAAQFVADVDLQYVKRCDNPECVRYFLDMSRNHSRRWCSMQGCGNRLKARAHYARKRE